VAVAIAVSSGGSSNSNASHISSSVTPCTGSDAAVCNLLNGIPQSGNTLGNPQAPVTVTEFGDLQCPICADFATQGVESQLIKNEVRQGKVKLVYRSLMTATGNSPNPGIFGIQQASAGAAGLQKKAWYYIELFYHHQGAEGSGYVNQTFLNDLAKRVPGLTFSQWLSDSHSQPMLSQVSADQAYAQGKGYNSTPTLEIKGPKGQTQPIVGVPNSYSDLQAAIHSVS
jgi:protein-disulfide isomerase